MFDDDEEEKTKDDDDDVFGNSSKDKPRSEIVLPKEEPIPVVETVRIIEQVAPVIEPLPVKPKIESLPVPTKRTYGSPLDFERVVYSDGASLAVRIPKGIVSRLGLKPGDTVAFEESRQGMFIRLKVRGYQ